MKDLVLKLWRGERTLGSELLKRPLRLLSSLYGFGLKVRERMYASGLLKTEEVSIPVISVGNITVGGTGKTPVVERLSKGLRELGFKPGIVTRGYKRKRKGIFSVNVKRDDARDVGDEAYMLARRTGIPVIVGSDRAHAIDEGIKSFGIDVAVLDDGFQVRNLKKDMEILLLNGAVRGRPRPNVELLPSGPCREPLNRILDADIILINKGELDTATRVFAEAKPAFNVRYRPAYLYNLKHDLITHYNFLKGRRVLAFSGLGDNQSFFGLLKEIGARVVRAVPFPDHHAYTIRDIERITAFREADLIVTTEKDAVKILGRDIPDNLFYLAIEAQIEGEEDLLELIQRRVSAIRFHASHPA